MRALARNAGRLGPLLGALLLAAACRKGDDDGRAPPGPAPSDDPAPPPSEAAGPSVPIFEVTPPPSAETILERLAPALGLEVTQTRRSDGMLVARGQCGADACQLAVVEASGAIDFRRLPERPDDYEPAEPEPELERPRLPRLPRPRFPAIDGGQPLPPVEESPLEPAPSPSPTPQELWSSARELVGLVTTVPERMRATAEERGDAVVIHVGSRWSAGEGLDALVLGTGAHLEYRDGVLASAWIHLPTAEPIGELVVPRWSRVEAESEPHGSVVGEPLLAYRVSPSAPRGRVLPGVVVLTGAEAESDGHHHDDDEHEVSGSHHHGRTLFLQMCSEDAQCGEGSCTDGLCGGSIARGTPPEGADGGDDPEESDAPQLFDEEVDVDSLCGEQTDPDELAFTSGGGWTGVARNVSKLGLVLDDVALANNSFARRVESVRGYTLVTSRGEFECELDHADSQPTGAAGGVGPHPHGDCYSTLMSPAIRQISPPGGGPSGDKSLALESIYCVDGFPAATDLAVPERCRAKLLVAQRYIFQPPRSGGTGNFDISDSATWNPAIDYAWVDPPADCPPVAFESITIRTKIDNDVPGRDIAGFFRDPDDSWAITASVARLRKTGTTTFANRGSPGAHDNFHQKDAKATSLTGEIKGAILLTPPDPMFGGFAIMTKDDVRRGFEARNAITIPGCSGQLDGEYRCAHYHWRWGTALGKKFPTVFVPAGGTPGAVLTPASQTVEGRVSKPVSAKDLREEFDSLDGSDLQLWLTVTSDAASDRVHYFEHFFFR